MAGFLRKKVRQEPPPKPNPGPPSSPTNAISTPLFARFATTKQAPQETPRVVSSPMLLSSTARRDAAPVAQNRRGRVVSGNNTSDAAHRDVRNAEVKSQRIQPYASGKAHETPDGTLFEASLLPPNPRRQPSATQVRTKPASRVPMIDKPLPPSHSPVEPDPFSSNSYSLTSVQHLPAQTPPHSQAGSNEHSRPAPPHSDKPLPQPGTKIPSPVSQLPQHSDRVTPKHNRRPSANSVQPANLLPRSSSIMNTEKPIPGRSPPIPQSRVQKLHLPIPSAHVHETPADTDHDLRAETLIPQTSNRLISREDLQMVENEPRPHSGASAGRSTPPNELISQSYLALLDVAFGSGPLQGSDEGEHRRTHQASHSPVPTGDFSSIQQEFDSTYLPSPSSSPGAHRKLSKVKPNSQPFSAPRVSAVHVENAATASRPLPIKPDDRKLYYTPADNMGLNISSPDISALRPSYKDLEPVVQHRGSSPVNNASPQQPISNITVTPSLPRTSPSMKSVDPLSRKPLIFAAMAAVDQEVNGTSDRHPGAVDHMKTRANPPPSQRYPSPPSETSAPPRQDSLPSQFSNWSGQSGPIVAPTRNTQPATSQRPTSSRSKSPSLQGVHTPHMNSNRQLPQPNEQPAVHPSPSRTRKLSKTRIPGQLSSNFSIPPHNGTAGMPHRTPVKRPVTPVNVVKAAVPMQIEDDVVGVPLDDPFAKMEGVKLLQPTSKPETPAKDNTIKKRPSRQQLSQDGASEDFHSVSEGEHQHQMQVLDTALHAPPAPISLEKPIDQGITEEHPESVVDVADVTDVIDQEDRLTDFLSDPQLLSLLLTFLSFYDWCIVLSLSREIRYTLVHNPQLREEVLERFLKTVGYTRWLWGDPDPLSLSLQDLGDYMRGVSTPTHEYSRVAGLYIHSLSIHPSHRDQSLVETVNHLAASARAYTRVVLRLRAQAEKEASLVRTKGNSRANSRAPSRAPSPTRSSYSHSNHNYAPSPIPEPRTDNTFQSPLFRLRRAPLLRVFVPSPDGDWLSDKSVLECEAECRRASIMNLIRIGDVVWDVAVGDEGNVGRLVWDGGYLLDLDYTYSQTGDLPKYMPTLAFPPSYFHRVIRTGAMSANPIVHIDLRPWGEEIAMNLQLLQDRVRTETPQGAYHNVVRWVNRSSFIIRPPVRGAARTYTQYNGRPAPTLSRIPIPDSNGLFVDPGWYGAIIVETEGTNEALADLQDRCGPGAFPPRALGVNGQGTQMDRESKKVFRILREKSRPGEIWIRAVSVKERLL